MNIKKSALAAAVTAALALGVSGQAAATVYAGSSLSIEDLVIVIGQASDGGITPGGATVTSFNFNLTNTATLGGTTVASGATCSGTPASNSCTPPTAPALDALPATQGTPTRTNNDFAVSDGSLKWFPLSSGDWSNSDSVILTAQLVDGVPTSTEQIAQSNITNVGNASANAEIKSVTGFSFTFDLTNAGEMLVSFSADPDLIAKIVDEAIAAAGANINVSFTLSQNTGGDAFATWSPRGTGVNECIAFGGSLTCAELFDSENLNTNVGTSANNTSDTHSFDPNIDGMGPYGIYLTGLTAGSWTLTLNAVTSTLITRTAVPEPSMLGLVGIGLLGMGLASRRKKLA